MTGPALTPEEIARRPALPTMLTAEEVQAALGGPERISIRTVRRHARAGIIPGAVWVGQKLYFQRTKVAAWIEGQAGARVVDLHRKTG